MPQDIFQKIEELEQKIDAIYRSVERMKKYFLWTLILSLAFFVLPLIAIIIFLPSFLNTYTNYLGI